MLPVSDFAQEPSWSAEDDVQAYAEFVVDQTVWTRDYLQHIALPEMLRSVGKATAALKDLAEAMRQSEIRAAAGHPDLAELHVQLKGFYGE